MQTFLQMVARDLYNKVGAEGISRSAVVFPNKRARLFFNSALARQHEAPLWSPAYYSIGELLTSLSAYRPADSIRLVCELYRVFVEQTGSDETLDDFYFWGELLISDFDDIDKNLVDADRLFSNLGDLHAIIDPHDFLDEEQEQAIRQFFQNFSVERRTQLKERFVSLWEQLGVIYHRYRQVLAGQGLAYEGMLYRDAIERLDTSQLPHERYVLVGFNVLNRVERRFFELLQASGKAMFYWDYDRSYTHLPSQAVPPYTHEAGEFIAGNLERFPNELPADRFDAMRSPKQIHLLSSPTENAQARFLTRELADVSTDDSPAETAVVLCNEALLLPVLHALPPNVRHLNITMGFPLSQTPVYSFLSALVDLQLEGYLPDQGRYRHRAVQAVLKHPYTRQRTPLADSLSTRLLRTNRFYPLVSELGAGDAFLEQLFRPQSGLSNLCRYLTDALREVAVLYHQAEGADDSPFNQLYRESLFKSYTLINRLHSLADDGHLQGITPHTFRRLLEQLLGASDIPFHGEPAVGMQVMGVLETRNLDFRRLVMLSVNEGQLPRSGSDASFVPYHLRKAFGMTTPEHRNAVYAYHFYRLLERAEHITLLYNSSSDGLNRGEMSRFLLQLLVESPHPIRQSHLTAGQAPQPSRQVTIAKTPEVTAQLFARYDLRRRPEALLSPSALNSYLECPLRFYYHYVEGLKAPDQVSADIDSALFGTLFHRAAQLAYTHLTARSGDLTRADLERLLSDEVRLQSFVDQAFKEEFFHVALSQKTEYNGTQLINARVIASYLAQLLRTDLNYAPFCLEAMEEPVSEELSIRTPHGALRLRIGGVIDRIDRKDDLLRVVDYKTGGQPHIPADIDALFNGEAPDRPGYVFQTFLYAAVMCRKQSLRVAPALLYIHQAAKEAYTPVIEMGTARERVPVEDFTPYEAAFRTRLTALLEEIFGSEKPFTQTTEPKRCTYCDFKRLCRR